MKVLQLVTTPRPFFDDQVQALEDAGIACTTLTVPGEPGERTPADYLRFIRHVRAEATDGYDIVHANYGLTAPAAFAQPVRPVVVTLWGSDLMGGSRLLTEMSRLAARRADAAVVPARTLSRYLDCPHYHVPFGVDTDLFRPIPRSIARKRVGWEADRNVVLFPYDPNRGVKDFPRAERVVARLQTDATLRTIGGIPHEQMPEYMNASDVVLVTSRRESGPMVIKEAAACNVPVVTTNVGFAQSVLDPVSNSAVCETDGELSEALEAVLASSRRSDGRRSAIDLDPDRVGTRLRNIYESLLQPGTDPEKSPKPV